MTDKISQAAFAVKTPEVGEPALML
jgi:hypothetical protein